MDDNDNLDTNNKYSPDYTKNYIYMGLTFISIFLPQVLLEIYPNLKGSGILVIINFFCLSLFLTMLGLTIMNLYEIKNKAYGRNNIKLTKDDSKDKDSINTDFECRFTIKNDRGQKELKKLQKQIHEIVIQYNEIKEFLDFNAEEHFKLKLIVTEKLPNIIANFNLLPNSIKPNISEIFKTIVLVEQVLTKAVKEISNDEKVKVKYLNKYLENELKESIK